MTPLGLARKIVKLPERGVVTAEFERKLTSIGAWDPERESKKYPSQKEHWLRWLAQYGTAGHYGRKNRKVSSAEIVYNRINCPPMLLWLAEAAGAPNRKIRAAVELALSVAPSYPRQCASIRKALPWSTVEERLRPPRAKQLVRK
jgi:hypothetical protein